MPGKRNPADPGELSQIKDANPTQAGIQQNNPNGAQFRHGEAPAENAYREQNRKPDQA